MGEGAEGGRADGEGRSEWMDWCGWGRVEDYGECGLAGSAGGGNGSRLV